MFSPKELLSATILFVIPANCALKQKEDEDRKVSDIESKDHYSIELEKQKSEHDKRMRKAEEKKMEVRRTIAKLRRQFKKLLEQNQELPEHLQLQRKVRTRGVWFVLHRPAVLWAGGQLCFS